MSAARASVEEQKSAIEHPSRQPDRRKHERQYFTVPVRFMVSVLGEYSGELVDISAGGMCIKSEKLPNLGDDIVLYVDNLGRFEGKVLRVDAPFFAIEMKLSKPKLLRFQNSLERFFLKGKSGAPEADRPQGAPDRRISDRIMGDLEEKLTGQTEEGNTFQCAVKNISLGGIEIVTKASLDVGEKVRVGAMNGMIARKTAQGYAILREDALDAIMP